MYEVDEEKLIELISVINKYLKYLDDKNIDNVEVLKDDLDTYFAVSMALFTIINKLIELGEELVDSLDKGYFPKTYIEIPKILFREHILTKNQYKLFADLIEYRNNIAHEYEQIYENEIFWCIKNIVFVSDFVKIVKKRLL
jgi:uncharacterized protein YutE (UPF0331/DUF86 family)